MSEFLQDLLRKVKQDADALEAPPAELDSKSDSNADVSPKQEKRIKSGSRTKLTSGHKRSSEPDLPTTPGLDDAPSSAHTSDLSPEPDLPTTPGLDDAPSSAHTSDLSPKPDLPIIPGLASVPDSEPDLPTTPGLDDAPPALQALRTFADSRATINTFIPPMKDSELLLYHYFVEIRYGNKRSESEGIISYSQKEAMRVTGIKSTATIVKAMTSLCKKKLIKWVRKARKRGEISLVRVFLPEDIQGFGVNSDLSSPR